MHPLIENVKGDLIKKQKKEKVIDIYYS